MNRLDAALRRVREQDRLALFPYLTAGYPDDLSCEELLMAAVESGADGLELGIPFSDPLADGVTLQRASYRALQRGATLGRALDLAHRLSARSDVPLVFMSYLNPLLAYGFERFTREAAAAGVNGLIVPDVPVEEAEPFQTACSAAGIHYIYMLAPTSTLARIRAVAERASGFVYCVALVGVTGARSTISGDLATFLGCVRQHVSLPLLVGFGVSRPEHVRTVREAGADAAVVASALVDQIDASPEGERIETVRRFVGSLAEAARGRTRA